MIEIEMLSLRSRLIAAEQERDKYKAELVECSRLIEQMQVSEHQKHLELESLRAKIKELESLKFFMELHENGYFIPIEGQNFEFTKD